MAFLCKQLYGFLDTVRNIKQEHIPSLAQDDRVGGTRHPGLRRNIAETQFSVLSAYATFLVGLVVLIALDAWMIVPFFGQFYSLFQRQFLTFKAIFALVNCVGAGLTWAGFKYRLAPGNLQPQYWPLFFL